MKVNIFKALWGVEGTYREQFKRTKEAGFHGIEAALPSQADKAEFKELLEEYNFDYIAQIFTGGNHADSFAQQVQQAAAFKPVLINSHSSLDRETFEQQASFFEQALVIERQAGIAVGHETHRQRAMFTPWTTANLLEAFDELKITADFSHWVCVCESHLADNLADLELAIKRTIHIHARVGYPEGPQVPDPSAKEYAYELELFEKWWKQILNLRQAQGAAYATVTPEFGPPGYLHTLPHTNQPVADLWQVNDFIAQRFRENFPKRG
ncbi:sugar phosphate isomerase/epimerase family protein [Paenibacillus solisilvae]|uniref:Sugar phosphate isomerase/epimerase family protein n=1 Tax=Paenibacillus solisilvae TaxID=2486751 RepID=A0ABW0VSR4_9BACL